MNELSKSVETIIKAQIAEALAGTSDGDSIIEKLVSACLENTIEVNDPDRGAYYKKKVPFLEHQVDLGIQAATEQAVREVISENRDLVKQVVKSSMEPHLEKMTSNVLDGLTGNDWRVSVNVEIPREVED